MISNYIYGGSNRLDCVNNVNDVKRIYSDKEVIDKFEVLDLSNHLSDNLKIDKVESENVLYHYFISDSIKVYIKSTLSPILYKILITLLQKAQYKLVKTILSYYFPHYQIAAILLKLL